ncbi:MAG: hypothetical protein ACOX6A_04160 [Atribacter sp.]|uniref:hypothetical protein n=1 Tax=Atribacter sp. TaxID=2847780 RepID=UPI003D95E6E1
MKKTAIQIAVICTLLSASAAFASPADDLARIAALSAEFEHQRHCGDARTCHGKRLESSLDAVQMATSKIKKKTPTE